MVIIPDHKTSNYPCGVKFPCPPTPALGTPPANPRKPCFSFKHMHGSAAKRHLLKNLI
jgi:hypothetical protein